MAAIGPGKRHSWRNLWRRILLLPVRVLARLGIQTGARKIVLGVYFLSGLFTAMSIARVAMGFDIALSPLFQMASIDALYRFVIDTLTQPLDRIGWTLSDMTKSIIGLSCVGASVFVNADFLERWRLIRWLSGNDQQTKVFDEDWSQPPKVAEPVTNTPFWLIFKIVISLIAGYLFLGLIPFLPMMAFGLYFFARDIVFVAASLGAIIFFALQEMLARYERPGEDRYWGTRAFLAAFRLRDRCDNFLQRAEANLWRLDSIRRKDRWWMLLRGTVRHGAHIVSLAIWILLIAGTVSTILG